MKPERKSKAAGPPENGYAAGLLHRRNIVLSRLIEGVSLPEIMGLLIASVEAANPDIKCAIRLLEGDGKYLRLILVPSLPGIYRDTAPDILIEPGNNPSAQSVLETRRVVVEDITVLDNWRGAAPLLQDAAVRAFCPSRSRHPTARCWARSACIAACPTNPTRRKSN